MGKKQDREQKNHEDIRESRMSIDDGELIQKTGRKEPVTIPSKDEIEESLTAIYEGQPTKEWLNTLDHGRRRIWVMILMTLGTLILVVSAAAWLGFWFFGSRGFNGKGIEIQIEGPRDVSVGQEVSYRINWFNVSREPLASTEFRVSFPNDFKIIEVDPKPTSEPLVFRLGAQPIEGRGTIKVKGVFTGAIGTKSVVQVVTTYRPASYNSDFEALNSLDIEYANSMLQGNLQVPEKVIPGDNINIVYVVSNGGSQKLEDVRARFILPEGFALSASSTEDDPNVREIFKDIGALEAGASTSVQIFGKFAARSGGELKMIAESGFTLANGEFAPAQRAEAPISVLAGDLDLEVVINGSQDDRNVSLGEWQRISLSYQNLSGERLSDVRLALRFEPQVSSGTAAFSLIDWAKLDDSNKGTRKGNVLSFTAKEIKDLALLEKDQDGFIEIAIPMISSATSGRDVPLLVSAEGVIGKVGGQKANRLIQTRLMMLQLQTDASVQSVARYTSEEGAPIGSGPLPPVVGSSTTYRIEWSLQKTLHELDRVTLTATLPSSAIWVENRDVGAGELNYDDQKKLVTWTINKMPEDIDSLIATFDVMIRPTESDLGRFCQLLGETRVEFTDVKLNQTMIRTAPAVTTDLPDDEMAARKGVVSR